MANIEDRVRGEMIRENIPADGGALVVGNHAGTIGLDAAMVQLAIHDAHPNNRHLRPLGADVVLEMVEECVDSLERTRQMLSIE